MGSLAAGFYLLRLYNVGTATFAAVLLNTMIRNRAQKARSR